VLDFKDRRRDIWGRSYTELFFLDEPTAFAAGHRPCFECRRKDAGAFAEKWREARRLRRPPYAAEMDEVLHTERLRGGFKSLHGRNIDELPDGAFDGAAFAVRATRSYTGRRMVTMLASRGRVASLSVRSSRR
jgi:hypothetical protein